MTYQISREDIAKKVHETLYDFGDLYTFDDIMENIEKGLMQSFTVGETWIVTQVHEFPRRKVLEVAFVVGKIQEAVEALPQLEEFAKSIGATRISAFGRDGWWRYSQMGWRKVGTMFAKDL